MAPINVEKKMNRILEGFYQQVLEVENLAPMGRRRLEVKLKVLQPSKDAK